MDRGADALMGLRDIRAPLPTLETMLADCLMAFVAGLIIAILIALIARIFFRRKRSRREDALRDLEAMRHLPAEQRLLAQAVLLRQVASHAPSEKHDLHWTAKLDAWLGSAFFTQGAGTMLRDALYCPDRPIDPDVIDREMAQLFNQMKG
jgi:hypothetical protein